MAMDRIDCLRAFVRALEGGSFSAAAAELGIGQPAVSKRIALLESEFGTQLFFRTTRKLRPTPEAHRIYQLAREILSNFDTARASGPSTPCRLSGDGVDVAAGTQLSRSARQALANFRVVANASNARSRTSGRP